MTRILRKRVSPGSMVRAYYRGRGFDASVPMAPEWRSECYRREKRIRRTGLCRRRRIGPSTKEQNAQIRRAGARGAYDVCLVCRKWRCVGASKVCVVCTYCSRSV